VFTIEVPLQNVQYTTAVSQYLLYKCRHTVCNIQVKTHNVYY